jgi:Sel1 repeat-containing protein
MSDNPEPSFRTSESERFTPTLKQDVSDNALVGLGMLVFVPLILSVRRAYLGHPISWTVALACGAGGAFLGFLFYTCRFLLRAPRSVRFSDTALILELRDGRESEIRWSDVRRATRSSYGGLRWRLWTDDAAFNVRADGFSTVQWQEISNHISQQLTAREIPISIGSANAEATEQNRAIAQYKLGICYANGDGVAKDQVEAVKWYRKAAEQNLANAQNNLGVCYEYGKGVAKDQAEAVMWYRKAAEQNLAAAQYNLGLCYAKGEGVAKDQVEAAKWYRKAAEQNDADAQYNLGVCYDNGEGVAKDYVEAYKWRLLAARQGDEDAKKTMTMLENKMTPEQIAEGQKLAGNFKPR